MTVFSNQHESDIDTGTIVCVASSHVVIADGDPECDPSPFLRVKKLRKYMGKQDDLAVYAACNAMNAADLIDEVAADRFGLYLAVGYIPFEEKELTRLCEASDEGGRFSMRRLSTTGFHAVNGLMTFRCLPNMPAFHVSTNLDIRGPSFVTYPGAGQLYVALQQACDALNDREVDAALVMGVADQRNFLVRHHLDRMPRQVTQQEVTEAVDAAGCLILRRSGEALPDGQRIATLCELHLNYRLFDPFEHAFVPNETISPTGDPSARRCQTTGPSSLPVHLSRVMESGNHSGSDLSPTEFRHQVTTHDGISASSRWELS